MNGITVNGELNHELESGLASIFHGAWGGPGLVLDCVARRWF